ncbi:MAG: hypothetical protein K0S41_3685 [Anaerocolumna sp.]|jgi:hypothetical protein|nr:hypothetical protein [Anaerocolumna sp.]
MLNEKKINVIEMIATGDFTISEAMAKVGMDRTTYYKWKQDVEFMAELNNRLQDMKTQASKDFVSRLPKALEEYWKICLSSTDVRTKEKALSYWIDRSLGRIGNIQAEEGRNEDDINIEDILSNIVKINNKSA